MKLIIYAVAALLLTGGTRSPTTSDEKHLEYGAKFGHVAVLRCEVPKVSDNVLEAIESLNGIAVASCVIVSPNHILTAAHVVRGYADWTVTTEDGKSRVVKRVSVHPQYGHGGGCFDLAVGYTEEPFGLDWYPAIYEDSDEQGLIVSIAGYGMTGDFKTGGVHQGGGKRRAGSNCIDSATEDYLICSASGPPWTSLEFLICWGDSGGGLFIGNKLAGINSAIMAVGRKPKATYGEESVHVRLSRHREWILEEIRCDE